MGSWTVDSVIVTKGRKEKKKKKARGFGIAFQQVAHTNPVSKRMICSKGG